MKFGVIISEQQARFPELRFFGYNRLKQLIKEEHATTTEQFVIWVDFELELLDKGHEKMIESGADSRLHYKWSRLNSVAVAKIIKKWNRRSPKHQNEITDMFVAEKLRETKFYQMTYSWTAPDEKIECPLCHEHATDPVIYTTACSHRFCSGCAVKTACTQPGFGCPVCRQGTLRTLALEPVCQDSQADDWPKASTLLSSLKKLEGTSNKREPEQVIEMKVGFEAEKPLQAPPPLRLRPTAAPALAVPLLELPDPFLVPPFELHADEDEGDEKAVELRAAEYFFHQNEQTPSVRSQIHQKA